MNDLADDLLPDLESIAAFTYGRTDPRTLRRLRHLISSHNFPAKKIGGRLQSRRTWIASFFDQPDQPKRRDKT